MKDGKVQVRKFEEKDVPLKVKWINDTSNNQYLHYDLPLTLENTFRWFNRIKDDARRFDATILYESMPVGIIGLLSIDSVNRKAEFYITLGEVSYKGKGIAEKASKLLINYAFEELGLNKLYLYTEEQNLRAQKLFEKIGFLKEGLLRQDLFIKNEYKNRFSMSILKDEYPK